MTEDIVVEPVDIIRGKRSTKLVVVCPVCNHRHTYPKPDEREVIDAFCNGRWFLVTTSKGVSKP